MIDSVFLLGARIHKMSIFELYYTTFELANTQELFEFNVSINFYIIWTHAPHAPNKYTSAPASPNRHYTHTHITQISM